MTTITLLQLLGIIPTKGTWRKCNNSLGGKVKVKYKQTYILDWFSHCVSKTYIRQNTVLKKHKPQFWERCRAGVQFQRKKNHLQTPIRCKSCDFSCHSTELTQKAWKPQFWPADFIFPSMAAALYLCPKLVNLSRSGCLHVTFKWHNHMQLAQWEKLRLIVRQRKGGLSASKQICWQCQLRL